MTKDFKDLLSLHDIASKHHDRIGADALKYYHRLTEDENYYFTHTGEEYGISHIQGGYGSTEAFIKHNS